MSNGSQFDGVALAIGVVRGARSFDYDTLGRLTGVSYKQVWTPGENVAECRKKEASDPYGMSYSFSLVYEEIMYGKRKKKPEPKPEPKVEPPHTMAGCACGFYGYYDGSNDYHNKNRISAVVEGYGETLIGTRGFRVTKARILALRIHRAVPAKAAAMIERNYTGIPFYATFAEMVEAFPPDAGEHGCTPESDPEFWTRQL